MHISCMVFGLHDVKHLCIPLIVQLLKNRILKTCQGMPLQVMSEQNFVPLLDRSSLENLCGYWCKFVIAHSNMIRWTWWNWNVCICSVSNTSPLSKIDLPFCINLYYNNLDLSLTVGGIGNSTSAHDSIQHGRDEL